MQPLRNSRDHLLRRLWPSLLLDSGVVVRRHVAEQGNLFAAQPARAAAVPPGQAYIVGLQSFAALAQKLGEAGAVDVHCSVVQGGAGLNHG